MQVRSPGNRSYDLHSGNIYVTQKKTKVYLALWSATANCGVVSVKQGARSGSLSHLVIAGLDPLLVEAVGPEFALAGICSVIFPTIDASGGVGARLPLRCSRNGGNHSHVSPATARQCAVVLTAVGARTSRTLDLGSATCLGGVTPPPAFRTERGARVCPSFLENGNPPSELDSTPDEGLSPRTVDRVSDVKINTARIRLWGVTHHAGRGLEDDVIFPPCLRNYKSLCLHKTRSYIQESVKNSVFETKSTAFYPRSVI
jgi:hypothetical protein